MNRVFLPLVPTVLEYCLRPFRDRDNISNIHKSAEYIHQLCPIHKPRIYNIFLPTIIAEDVPKNFSNKLTKINNCLKLSKDYVVYT
jgi:hypothetical protein